MDTKTVSVLTATHGRLVEHLSEGALAILDLGQRRQWDTAVLGFAPVPKEHVFVGKYMIVPAHLDSSPLPQRTWERVRAIHATGLNPEFVVVHETPALLKAPAPEPPRLPSWDEVSARLRGIGQGMVHVTNKAAPIAWEVTKVIGKAAITVAAATAMGTIAMLGLAVSALAVDPILIACFPVPGSTTGEHVWIEIDRWMTE